MNRLEQLCTDRGLRMSEQRRAILQVIDEARDHPNVEEIHRRTQQKDAEISLATVYRTINILTRAGLLTRLELGDGKVRYEEAGDDHHEHLVDVQSGAVVEFRNPGIEALIRDAAATLGYSLVDYRLEVFAERQAPDPAVRASLGETGFRGAEAAASAAHTTVTSSRPRPGSYLAAPLAGPPRRNRHAHQ